MPEIISEIEINAPIERVFDLARSIDLHEFSMNHTNEKAIAGKIRGLIGLHEWVTWRAKHFGFWQTLTSHITEFRAPFYFSDEMVSGIFKSFQHEHYFEEKHDKTIVRDKFDYTSPLGAIGKFADLLFLESYMAQLFEKRNNVLKKVAESNNWKDFL